jgi:hypothetical protein
MTITASETSLKTAIAAMNALRTKWTAFDLEQHMIACAHRYVLSPEQANEMIALVRSDLAALDMDKQLLAIAETLERI